jgi:hypothetical protein
MRDASGKELTIGSKVVVPCNSRFKIGVLYNIRPNNGKHYRTMCEYVANRAQGLENYNDANLPYYNTWRERYYTQERVDAQREKAYIRFPDGKTRSVTEADNLLMVPEDTDILV